MHPSAFPPSCSFLAIFLCWLGLAFSTHSADPPATIVWGGAANNLWNNPANWTPARVPNATDIVEITRGANMPVVLNVNATVNVLRLGTNSGSSTQALSVAGVTLTMSGESTVRPNGVLHFDGGTLVADTKLRVEGVMNWSSGVIGGLAEVGASGLLNLSTSGDKVIWNGAAIQNFGEVVRHEGRLVAEGYSARSLFVNNSNAVFRIAGGLGAFGVNYTYQEFAFSNLAGGLVLRDGTGEATISGPRFVNEGEIRLDNGTLAFHGNARFSHGTRLNGAGASFAGGTLTFDGDLAVTRGPFEMKSGTMDGKLVVRTTDGGSFHWSGGTLRGSMTIAPGSGIQLDGIDNKVMGDHSVITNFGSVLWSSGVIVGEGYAGPSTFVNASNGLFQIAADGPPFSRYNGYQPFNFMNQAGGILRKSGSAGVNSFNSIVLNNGGLIDVQAGRIDWTVPVTLLPGSVLRGPGEVRVIASSCTLHGSLVLDGVSFTHEAGSLVSATTNTVLSSLNNGSFRWSGGWLSGQFKLAAGLQTHFSGGDHQVDDFAEIINDGTLHWTAGAIIASGYSGPSTIRNRAGSLFLLNGGTAMPRYNGYQHGRFIVEPGAEMRKLDAGTLLSNWQLFNDGVASVHAGNWRWNAGGSSAGSFSTLVPGTFSFHGGTHTLTHGATLNGTGRFCLDGGRLDASGVVTFGAPGSSSIFELDNDATLAGSNFVSAATFNWINGWVGGHFTVAPSGVVNATGPANKSLGDFVVFENHGLVNWMGPGPFAASGYSGPSTILNRTNGVFQLSADGHPFVRYNGYQVFAFNTSPGSQWRKTSGGTVRIENLWPTLQGDLRIDGGLVEFNAPTAFRDGFRVRGPGRFRQVGSSISLEGQATLDGATAEFAYGDFVMVGNGRVRTLNGGLLDWQGSTIYGALTLTNNSQMRISGSDTKTLADGAEINNYGTLTFAQGPLHGSGYSGPARIRNHASGKFIVATNASMGRNNGYVDNYFINDGTVALGQPGALWSADSWWFTQNGVGSIELQLAGTNAPLQHGRMAFNRPVALGGFVRGSLANGFTPAPGQEFNFLDAPSLSGELAPGVLPPLSDGLVWTLNQSATSVSLRLETNGVCAPIPSGLIAWYPGENSAYDVIGSHTGTLLGTPSFVPGKVGRAFRFNGSDSSVDLGPWFNRQVFSFALWVKEGDSQHAYADIFDNNHTGYRSFVMQWNNTEHQYGFGGGLPGVLFDLTPGVWQHVVVTREPGFILRVYVDGKVVQSVTNSVTIPYDGTEFLRLSAWGGGGRHWNGQLDEFQIYDRGLNASEVAALYSSGRSGLCTDELTIPTCIPQPGGLIGWWSGDNTTNDFTGISGGATLLNGAGFASGISAQAFNLDGANDLISIGQVPGLQSATELTLMAWVYKTAGANNIGGILGKWDTSENPTQNSFLLFNGEDDYVNRGGLALQFNDGTFVLLKGTNTLPIGNWVHITATWRSSDGLTRLYKNGVLEAQTNRGAGRTLQYHTAYPARIGEWGASTRPNSFWQGKIDEALILNRALASNEVAAIVRAGPEGLCRLSLPDLMVRNVTAPTNAAVGQPISITFVLTNQGNVLATGTWHNAVLLSTTAGGASADTIGSLNYTGAVPPNGSVTLTQTVILPASIFGPRYLGVSADSGSAVVELNEANNTTFAATSLTIAAADLSAVSLSAPAIAQFGQSISVQFSVTNQGGVSAASSWSDEIYLSPSETSLAGATLLEAVAGTSPLAAGNRYARTVSVQLPLTISSAPGPLFLIALVDADNNQVESDESNNLVSTPITVMLPPLPDLAVHQVQAPAFALPGRDITLIWSVTNRGNAAANGAWNDVVGLSNSLSGQLILGEFRYTNLLSPGQFLRHTQTVSVPSTVPAGTWNTFVTSDARSEIVESDEVNNTSIATNFASVPALLTLDVPANLLKEGDASILATVTRNGDRSLPLIVTVTNSHPGDLGMTNTVVIPADAASATFTLTPIHDQVVDGNRFVVFGVTGDDYQGASFALTVADIDVPTLILSFGATTVAEGMTVPCTVTRDYATNRELVVVLNAGDSTQLTSPTAITIPSNQLSYTFAVLAVDNNVIEPTRTNSLIASAAGFESATATIATTDNDLPTVTLRFAAHSVSEGAGPQATVATITRNPVSPRGLRLALTGSDDASAQLPAAVTIPGGQESASFPLAAVDNQAADGMRSVSFRVLILDVAGNVISEGSGDTVQVLDDDGPTLKLAIDRDAVPEGQTSAAAATITRNTATNIALTIALASSQVSELTVPATVVMPAGADRVTVPLNTPLDGLSDGNKSVTVTATANGFTPGSAVIVVTDIDLPDLVVRNVSTPTNGTTDANFAITYRIENRGIAACTSNFVARIYLSSDSVPSSDDRLLSEFPFEGSMPVGQFVEQTAQYPLPGKSGRYWVIIVADADHRVPEVLENNNTYVASLPIVVSPSYQATVQTAVTTALTGTPIEMAGVATRSEGGVMPNAPLNIHVGVRGTQRTLTAQTDATGHFMVTWVPLPGEAGNYQIGAAHPGEDNAPVQDTFSLIGLKLAPPISELTVTEGLSITSRLAVVNLGETTLNGVTAQVVGAPANLGVTATLSDSSVVGDGTAELAVVFTAHNSTVSFGEVRVRVTAPGGVSADALFGIHISALRPRLVAAPDSLYSIMIGGKQTVVEFDLVNDGGVATGPLTVSVPVAPWLSIGTTNPIPAMHPGSTNRITLLLTPSVDLPLGPYRNSVVVSDGFSAGVSVPFEFLNVSEGKGHLRVAVVDEYTYYALGGPKVTNAAVTIRDAISQAVIMNGVTDASGEIVFQNLTEAYYQIEVTADKHSSFTGTLLLRGGRTNDFEAFLSRETVQYRWSVSPATIEDRTRITITTEFETFVPVPVITIDPPLIDLKDFSGSVTQINLVIANHGLVAAQDFEFELPEHPDFEITSLVSELGPIPAMTTLNVPLTIRRVAASAAASGTRKVAKAGSGPCSVSAGGCWQLPCGGRKTKRCTPVAIINLGNCAPPPVIGGPSGGTGQGVPPVWAGFPYGGVGGAGYQILNTPGPFVPPFSFEPPKICDCDPDDFDDKCLKVPLSSSILNSALDALSSKLNNLQFVSDVKISTEAAVEVCICCSKPEGIGAKVSGGGSVTFKGKATFPMGGFPISKDVSAGGLDFKVTGTFGCSYEQEFEFQASVNGKTECQFKKPTVDGSLSVDLPATFGCAANVKVVVSRNGSVLGEVDVGPVAQVTYGLSGSVKYHKDENSSSLTGEICGKGLKVHMGIPVKIPGIVDTDLPYDATLVEENCGSFSTAAAILAKADASYEKGWKDMQQMVASNMDTPTSVPTAKMAKTGEEEGVCAKVKLQLDQDVVMARNAFNATLELANNSPLSGLSNVSVTLVIENEFGETVNEVFGVRAPVLKGLTGVDGRGTIGANSTGSASWILVPTSAAAPFGPTRYGVGGVLSYYQDGNAITIPLFSAPITVYPDPRLSVQYFHQRDVYADDPFTRNVIEPTVPFNLAVMVKNKGRGTARDVKIVSGQPQIIENEKGLLINFEIIGSQVEQEQQTPSLTATIGEIPPGTNRMARWLMTSTLQGLFTDYKATFMHQDSLGKTNLSLIDEVTIHEMIHVVQAPGAFEDHRPDYLVNDVRDPEDLPDSLYLSDGRTNKVEPVLEASHDGAPSESDFVVRLSAAVAPGWTYLRVPEPSDGRLILTRVVRSDNVEISLGTNAWTTDRLFIGQGQRPIYTNLLHLIDYDSTGEWTLYYAPLPQPDTTAPASIVAALPASSYGQIPVNWSGTDEEGGSGIAFFDIVVSEDGGPFTPWLQHTMASGGIYFGSPGRTYAFYSIATDAAGNREAAPASPDAHTSVDRMNVGPEISLPSSVTINEGTTLTLSPVASDADAAQTLTFSLGAGAPSGVLLNSANGQVTWATSEGNGPSTNQLRIVVTDNGLPSLSATSLVTVVVNEVNSPPSIPALGNRTVNELQSVNVTVSVNDSDLPLQSFGFSLGAGAPSGASINGAGLFTWTPGSNQGPSTNRIAIIATDSGIPALSTTQFLTVTVRDSRPDFIISIGGTNVLAGQGGQVPLNMESGLDLTNVVLVLSLNSTALSNLSLAPARASIGSASLTPIDAHNYIVRLSAVNGDVLQGVGEFARMGFNTAPGATSAVVIVQPHEVVGVRSTGEVVPNGGGIPGRLVVVGREPVIMVNSTVPRILDVYMRPGVAYTVEYGSDAAGPWYPLGTFMNPISLRSSITPTNVQDVILYRVRTEE